MRRRRFARRRFAAGVSWLLLSGIWTPAAAELSPTEKMALALRFAPVLTFHPDERFFPTSPLLDVPAMQAGSETPRDAATFGGPGAFVERRRTYEQQPLDRKLDAALVYYRVVEELASPSRVRLEYWFYYFDNAYLVHGAWFPYTADGRHAHDLEQAFLTLEATPGASPSDAAGYVLREIWANAHVGSIANNHYRWPARHPGAERPSLIVELGAHAMAPDIDGDGRFTAGADATGDRTFVWGVRDRGDSWAWYRPSYMDERPPSRAVRLRPTDADDGIAACAGFMMCVPYRLEEAADLDARVREALTRPDAAAAISDGRHHWAKSIAGEVSLRSLLAPALHEHGRAPDRMRDRVARSERGILVGFTPSQSTFTTSASARYSMTIGPGYTPKAMFEAGTLFLSSGRVLGEVNASLWYPIDAVSKVIVGVQGRADLADVTDPVRRRFSPHAGFELRSGRWRLRMMIRSGNRQSRLDFRFSYVVFKR